MKQLSHLLTALVFCSLMIIISCGDKGNKPESDPADAVGSKLVATWTVSAVTVDSEARDEWTSGSKLGLTVTYDPATNSGSYTATNVPY